MESANPRIAVIDDDPEIRTLVRDGLAGSGFDVRAARDGVEGVALLRAWQPDAVVLDVSHVPIVLISVRGAGDGVAGIDVGELAARLRSALRGSQSDGADIIRFADLELDLVHRSARRGDHRVALSTREYALLMTLLQRPRRVFSKGELAELVWGADHPITPNTVETYISYLRAKLDLPAAPALIHTVRGLGYRLALEE